jgi:hypothetical protein
MAGRLRDSFAARLSEERGVTLVLVTALLVVFMGMAAFAVDLGWLYFNSLEIQHGADAGALAGVIYEPDDRPAAYAAAVGGARENGYVDGTLGGPDVVDPTDFVEDPTAVENTHQLRVTVSSDVGTFFMKVFGIDTVNITRTALAEYVLPLPLGSPDNNFGNDPSAGHWPNFWGNIHGYYTGRRMGDRYASQCLHGGSGSGCTKNDERRLSVNPGTIDASGGYLYGLQVEPGATNITVDVFDGPFTRGGGDLWLVGDQPQGGSQGPDTVFMLYGPDPTPLDTHDGNELLCVETFSPRDPYADFNGDGSVNNGDDQDADGDLDFDDVEIGLPGGVASLWDRMCSGTNLDRGPGIYPLRVMVPDPGGADDRGLNRWSLRSNATGQDPSIFGLGDMAIYANVDGTTGNTVFYLAEVEEVHAGKDLVIDLWDPGDASGNHSVRFIDPNGNTPACEYTSSNPSYGGTLGSCDVPTSSSRFNDHWIQIRISLPAGYTCGADCWWKIDYNYPSTTNDTTTWSARIEGNPVRLVE